MRKLLFFIGPAGAGKTTLAEAWVRRHGGAFLDMDTLLRPAAEAIMKLTGHNPNDRDSPFYKQHCRDLGYRITMDAALQQLSLGLDAVVIGPFTKETEDAQWLNRELRQINATVDDVCVKVVSVYLPTEDHYKDRIGARGSVLDAWKLDHWPQFQHSLKRRSIAWSLPESSVLQFDNAGPLTALKAAALEDFILS